MYQKSLLVSTRLTDGGGHKKYSEEEEKATSKCPLKKEVVFDFNIFRKLISFKRKK